MDYIINNNKDKHVDQKIIEKYSRSFGIRLIFNIGELSFGKCIISNSFLKQIKELI